MIAKAMIFLGLGLFTYFGLLQTPRALEQGMQRYLLSTFPGSQPRVQISAPLFWFLSGNLSRVSVEISKFDATRFPIPTVGGTTGPGIGSAATAAGNGEGAAAFQGDSASDRSFQSEPTTSAEPPRAASASFQTGPPGASPTVPGKTAGSPGAPAIRWARIGLLDVHLSDFRFVGQHITDFRTQIPGVRYDFGLARKQRLLRLGGSDSGSLAITLSESDLNQVATVERSDIRSLYIHTEQGQLRVTLDYHTLLGWVPVSVTGQLAVVDGHTIHFVHPAISAVRVPFPQPVTDFILARVQNVNPVFDLDRLNLPMDVSLTSAESTARGLVVRGTVQVPRP